MTLWAVSRSTLFVGGDVGGDPTTMSDAQVRAASRSISPPMGVNSISFGSPHVCAMGRTCGEPNEIKKNTHPKYITALFREQTSLFRNADVLEVSCSEANRCNDDPLLYTTTLNRHVKRGKLI